MYLGSIPEIVLPSQEVLNTLKQQEQENYSLKILELPQDDGTFRYYLAYKTKINENTDTAYTSYIDAQTNQEIYRFSNIINDQTQVNANVTTFGSKPFRDLDYIDA